MKAILTALWLIIGSSAFAQVNYVLNPDFETHAACPNNNDQISLATHWTGVDSVGYNTCVPDYCHSCVPYGYANSVPYCGYYWQYAHSGNGMAKVQMYDDEFDTAYHIHRDYLQGRLFKKLLASASYCVSFYINLAESSRYAVKDIGAFFDNGIIDTTVSCGYPQTQYTPQVSNSIGIISDTMNWIKVEGSFVASGNEFFITIGNFNNKALTTLSSIPLNTYNKLFPHISVYLVDDVSVIESDLPADAGPDTHVGQGDSVYIGRSKEIGLECTWSVLGNPSIIGTGAGIWVRPSVATSYEVTQTLCGVVKKDTVRVAVWPAGVHSINGQAQAYSLAPNPSNSIVQLSQVVIDVLPVSVVVYEATGKEVYDGQVAFIEGKATLDLQMRAPGFYYMQLQDSRGNMFKLALVRQ